MMKPSMRSIDSRWMVLLGVVTVAILCYIMTSLSLLHSAASDVSQIRRVVEGSSAALASRASTRPCTPVTGAPKDQSIHCMEDVQASSGVFVPLTLDSGHGHPGIPNAPKQQGAVKDTNFLAGGNAAIIQSKQIVKPPVEDAQLAPKRGYSFSLSEQLGRATPESTQWCPGSREPILEPLSPLHKVLFVLGTQKGGTTFLFRALEKHAAFVAPVNGYARMPDPWNKELHFFNRWPMPPESGFLKCFPEQYRVPPAASSKFPHILVDGTPDYMFNSAAAPRVKGLIPQAKFVVVLRDPVARAFSAWKMSMRAFCPESQPNKPCPIRDLKSLVTDEWNTAAQGGCAFDSPGGGKTWHDCYKCTYSHTLYTACNTLLAEDRKKLSFCVDKRSVRPFTTMTVSNYAAQLAWWFEYFHPDRFLIISSSQLRDASGQVQIMNKIMKLLDLTAPTSEWPQFTQDMISNVKGYDGEYTKKYTQIESDGIAFMKEKMAQSIVDVQDLLLRDPRVVTEFPGLATEM